jgi:hypothetical protein
MEMMLDIIREMRDRQADEPTISYDALLSFWLRKERALRIRQSLVQGQLGVFYLPESHKSQLK